MQTAALRFYDFMMTQPHPKWECLIPVIHLYGISLIFEFDLFIFSVDSLQFLYLFDVGVVTQMLHWSCFRCNFLYRVSLVEYKSLLYTVSEKDYVLLYGRVRASYIFWSSVMDSFGCWSMCVFRLFMTLFGPFHGAIAVPSVTRCRCRCRRSRRCRRGHRCAGGVRQYR